MNSADVRLLFAHCQWANRRLLGCARATTPEDFRRDLNSSFGSIQGTLIHIMAGEWRWLQFWLGKSYEREFPPEKFPTVEEVACEWQEVAEAQASFLGALTDEQLQARSIVRGEERPLEHTMLHILNHSSYHRGQVVTLLRQTGYAVEPLDFLVYPGETR